MLKYLNLAENYSIFNEFLSILKKNSNLIINMTRRDMFEQYSGQIIGKLWLIIHPLFFIGLYIFIFCFVLKPKISENLDFPMDYTSYLLSGIIPWLCFQQAIGKSCVALIGQANLVKQVVFPLEVIPVKSILSTIPTLIISILCLFFYQCFKFQHISLSWMFLPILLFFQIVLMIGVGLIVSATSVFVRDLKDFINVFLSIGIYLLPIVYLPGWVPEIFKPILFTNFFSYMIWCYQDVLYYGKIKHPFSWWVFFIESIVIFILGYRFFRKTKPHFGNYL